MAYNKAKEEKKWRLWKEAEEKQLRNLGVTEDDIEQLRIHDWAIFNSDRRYYQRVQETGTYGIRSLGCRELGLRTHLTSLCVELVEILSGCTGHGGYLAHRRIEIGCCFYSSNAKNCNCSRGRKELFTGGGNLIACRLQAFTSSSVLPGSSFRNFSTSLSWFYVFLISEFTPFKAVCSLVVSLPISTVIPLILLPAIGSSSLQNGYKNCPAFLPSIKKAPIRFLRPMLINCYSIEVYKLGFI